MLLVSIEDKGLKSLVLFVCLFFKFGKKKKNIVLIIALFIAAKTRNKLTDPQIVDRQNVGSSYQGVLFNHQKQ